MPYPHPAAGIHSPEFMKSIHSSKPIPFLALSFALVVSVCPVWAEKPPMPNLPEILNVGGIDYVVEVKDVAEVKERGFPGVPDPSPKSYLSPWDGHGAGLVKQVEVDVLKKLLYDSKVPRPFIMIDKEKYEVPMDKYNYEPRLLGFRGSGG